MPETLACLVIIAAGSNTPTQVRVEHWPPPAAPVETSPELKVRTAIYTEPVSAEKRQMLDADRDIVLAFGVTADQAIASLDRALAAMTCATEGHVWVDEQRLCSPAVTICGRCGFDPTTDMPLLWEGDQS